jgi:hypothetical protein
MGVNDKLKKRRPQLRQIRSIKAGILSAITKTSLESSTPGVDKSRHISPLKTHTIIIH